MEYKGSTELVGMSKFVSTVMHSSKTIRHISFAKGSLYLFVIFIIVSWCYIFLPGDSGFVDLFRLETWIHVKIFILKLAGVESELTPAFFQVDRWIATSKLAYRTLAMSVLAMAIAGTGAILTMVLAARNVSNGDLGGVPSRFGMVMYYLVRANYIVSRAVPELVWAMIIVFFLSPGLLPGALALGLHNIGIVGRLTAEVIENLDPASSVSLRSAGASNSQILIYGIMPQAIPHFITYLLYRWEVVIRTTVVVGFVSAGGLGREFILRLNWFHYTDVTLILIWYLLMVIGVDLLSTWLRKVVDVD